MDFQIMTSNKLKLIIPTIKEDFLRTTRNLSSFFNLLPISEIVFIGPEVLEECVDKEKKKYPEADRIFYINENDIIPMKEFMDTMRKRLSLDGYVMDGNSRPGWYYQQFLKMSFSKICEAEYYMTWDADTIPLRKKEMFNDKGKPFFDVKSEYIPGYFITIKKFFNIDKGIDKSFISEHMVFKTDFMKEMITEIEEMSYYGNRFYEKILYGIDITNMKWGFSEFETYGNWMLKKHPDYYAIREWASMRLGGYFLESSQLVNNDIEWLSTDFDAISFEGYNKVVPELSEAFHNKDYRSRYSAGQFYSMLLENGFFGEYENGMLKSQNGMYNPV